MYLLYKYFWRTRSIQYYLRHSHAITADSITRSDFGESAKIGDIKTALKSAFTIYRLELKPSAIEPFHYLMSNTNQIVFYQRKIAREWVD